jgi:hypothetical protein
VLAAHSIICAVRSSIDAAMRTALASWLNLGPTRARGKAHHCLMPMQQ